MCLFIYFYLSFSIAIHPNKMVVATGQVAGIDRRDAMVCFDTKKKYFYKTKFELFDETC